MVVEHELKKLLNDLIVQDAARLSVAGFDVTIRLIDDATKLSLSTPVYFGGNYIPQSVRKCLSKKPPFDSQQFKTFLKVDENRFRVSLHYLGRPELLKSMRFFTLLEEFSRLAGEWSLYLDEHDKNDLVHVRVP